MSETFPDDVTAAAKDVALDLGNPALWEPVVRAIMAERKRCIQILQGLPVPKGCGDFAERAAKAIRGDARLSELTFRIDADLSPERIEEYKAALNELLGKDLTWSDEMSESPKSAEVVKAIEVVKAHLEADWITPDCCEKNPAALCISCEAIRLRDQLERMAVYLRLDDA